MSKTGIIGLLAGLLLLAGAIPLFSQNTLLENPNYQRARELQRLAQDAYTQGDYDTSVEYSVEAERLSKLALEEAERARQRWVAFNLKNRAFERLSYAERVNAAERYPDLWPPAQEAYQTATSSFDAESYQESAQASRKVIELLASVEPEPVRMGTAVQEPTATPVKPAQYKVRLIEARRDCFWRIAEYDFVYGDPWKWRILYEANKHKLPNPNDPHIVLPGTVLDIPSLEGEKREGLWMDQ